MHLRNFFRRQTIDREMREEMQVYLDRATERLVARDLSSEEARRRAA